MEKYTVQQLVEKFNTIQLSLKNMQRGFECFKETTYAEFKNYFDLNANLSDVADNETVNEAMEICFVLARDQFENDKYNEIGKINCWFE